LEIRERREVSHIFFLIYINIFHLKGFLFGI